MDGILILYDSMISSEITKFNNEVFGRVVKIRQKNKVKYYFYDGILSNKKHLRIAKGCIFIPMQCEVQFEDYGYKVKMINATMQINDSLLYTSKEYFRNKYRNIEVINLD